MASETSLKKFHNWFLRNMNVIEIFFKAIKKVHNDLKDSARYAASLRLVLLILRSVAYLTWKGGLRRQDMFIVDDIVVYRVGYFDDACIVIS